MPISFGPETAWPPPEIAASCGLYDDWMAWYRGDPGELVRIYTGRSSGTPRPRPSQMAGGVYGMLGRFWWGRPIIGSGQTKLHVPAARDVANLVAAQLFADPPTLALPSGTPSGTQDALDELLNDGGVYAALHEAAALGAAGGGVYLRASANVDLAPLPIVEPIQANRAVPEWYGPYLLAVTFWRRIRPVGDTTSGPVVRHLERHEMRGGRCWVEHAVFEGGSDTLGRRVNLRDYPETAPFAELVDESSAVEIGTTRLDVVYVPGDLPNPYLDGARAGVSVYDSAQSQMDNLDEVWSSWMRDIRLGKGRLLVPRGYTRSLGEGQGSFFDPEQEVMQAVNAMPGDSASSQLAITPVQFAIRYAEHEATARALWEIIYRAAGLDGSEGRSEDSPQTATGVNAANSRKRASRATRVRYWTPALRQLGFVLLELLQLNFDRSIRPAPPDIEFPDASAPDTETQARTLQLLDAAGAVSTRTKVTMLHPDWDDDQVDEEVSAIEGAAAPPPDLPAELGAPSPADPQGDPQPVSEPVA